VKKGSLKIKGYMMRSGATSQRWVDNNDSRAETMMTQFIADYSVQGSYLPKGLITSTQLQHNELRTTNSSGRTAALGPIATSQIRRTGDQPGAFSGNNGLSRDGK
jgi:hypothetical protein